MMTNRTSINGWFCYSCFHFMGKYTAATLNHAGKYTAATLNHAGKYTAATLNHAGKYTQCLYYFLLNVIQYNYGYEFCF